MSTEDTASRVASVAIRSLHIELKLMSRICSSLGQDIMERIHCLEAD